jgi:hypothetical protein
VSPCPYAAHNPLTPGLVCRGPMAMPKLGGSRRRLGDNENSGSPASAGNG